MKRNAEVQLQNWLHRPRRKPLVLRGARQVGKSTLIRQFAGQQNLNLCAINLEKHLHLDPIFRSLDLNQILPELEAITGQSILAPNSLLFLDEIQATPHAIPALRYFYEEQPQLPVIAAGSLLEFVLQDHPFSMPVGRIEYLHLGPMTFKEFLMALGESALINSLENFQLKKKFPQSTHLKLVQRQREFMVTGGMPEAILEYVETSSFTRVQEIQNSIISTYQDDFAKYRRSSKDLLRLQIIFQYIPAHVGEKIKYAQISREERAREIRGALDLLVLAGLITPVFHSSCSGLPLGAQKDANNYKGMFLDIGLMNRIIGLDWQALGSMEARRLINEGGLAEQFIGQHLLYKDQTQTRPELFYWLREGRSGNAEVDYVISEGEWIVPIEVKAGKSGTLKSLQQFYLAKQPPLMIRFDLNLPSLQKISSQAPSSSGNSTQSYRLLSLPLYFVDELKSILEKLRGEF